MNRYGIVKRLFGVGMAILIFSCYSSTLASGRHMSESISADDFISCHEAKSEQSSDIVMELATKRTETSQTFLCEDGSFFTNEYSSPIAYRNDKDELVLYDNSIVDSDADGYKYMNSSADYRVYFGDLKHNLPVSIINHGASIALSNNLDRKYRIQDADSEMPQVYVKDQPSETVYYGDEKSGVLYSPHNDSLNQKFVFASSEAYRDITVRMSIGTLKCVENDTIEFIDNETNSIYFSFPDPIIIDSNGNITEGCHYRVISNEVLNNEHIITIALEVDNNISDLAFPIEINSNLMMLSGPVLTSTNISSLDIATVRSGGSSLYSWIIGAGQTSSGVKYRTYIRTSSAYTTLLGYTLERAVIDFKYFSATPSSLINDTTNGTYTNLYTRKVNTAWSSNTITWANQPIYTLTTPTSIPGHMDNYGTGSSTNWHTTFDITNEFSYTDTKGYMIALKQENMTQSILWYKNNSIKSNVAPKITLWYRSNSYVYPERCAGAYLQMDSAFSSKLTSAGTSLFYYGNSLFDDLTYPFEYRWNITWGLACNSSTLIIPSEWIYIVYNSSVNTYNYYVDYDNLYAYLIQQLNANGGRPPYNADILVTFIGENALKYQNSDGTYGYAAGMTEVPSSTSTYLGRHCTVIPDFGNRSAEVHLMWHELSHAFGCQHNGTYHTCTHGQLCCMSTGYDGIEVLELRTIWCNECASNFFNPTLIG